MMWLYMSFSSDLNKFAKKVESNGDKILRGTFLGVFASVMKRSPVGNPENWVAYDKASGTYKDYISVHGYPEGYIGGTFRGNWQTDVNKAPDGVLDDKDKTGAKSTLKAKTEAERANWGDSIYMVNNLPYAQRLENGWSTQAPRGMVKVTETQFKRIVNREAKKLK